jgi:hypothetical protein
MRAVIRYYDLKFYDIIEYLFVFGKYVTNQDGSKFTLKA